MRMTDPYSNARKGARVDSALLREMSRLIRQNKPQPAQRPDSFVEFLAVIEDHGPPRRTESDEVLPQPDFCDSRYWVRSVKINLTPGPRICLGACCNMVTGECTDDVTEAACMAKGSDYEWHANMTCEDVACEKTQEPSPEPGFAGEIDPGFSDPISRSGITVNPEDIGISNRRGGGGSVPPMIPGSPSSFNYTGTWRRIDRGLPVWAPAFNILEVEDGTHRLEPGTIVRCFRVQDQRGLWFLAFNPGGGGSTTTIEEEAQSATEVKIKYVVWNKETAEWVDDQECDEDDDCSPGDDYSVNADLYDEAGPFLVCRRVTGYTANIPDIESEAGSVTETVSDERVVVFPHGDMDIRVFIPQLRNDAQIQDYQIWDPDNDNDPVYHAFPMTKGLTLDFGAGLAVDRMVDTIPLCTTMFPTDPPP